MATIPTIAPGYPLDDWAMEAAIDAGNTDWVAQLIAAGADLARKSTRPSARRTRPGATPLAMAIENPAIVRLLLDAGAPVNQVAVSWGGRALHLAAMGRAEGVVQMLLEAGANPLLTDGQGRRPADLLGLGVAEHVSEDERELLRVATKIARKKRPSHR